MNNTVKTCKFIVKTLMRAVLLPYYFITHPAITCSKFTIETLEQGVKYVQS